MTWRADAFLADVLGADAANALLTPTKAAKAAKTEHPCGSQADPGICEGLRKLRSEAAAFAEFAELRNDQNGPQSEPRCGFSQDSQDSQASRGACASRSSVDDTPPPLRQRLHTLWPDLAKTAHAAPWDDDAIARFDARMAALLRRGYGTEDAEDLAQRLHVRDIDCDDRRACIECSHCGETGRCFAAARRRPTNAGVDLHRLHRCPSFGLRKGLA